MLMRGPNSSWPVMAAPPPGDGPRQDGAQCWRLGADHLSRPSHSLPPVLAGRSVDLDKLSATRWRTGRSLRPVLCAFEAPLHLGEQPTQERIGSTQALAREARL